MGRLEGRVAVVTGAARGNGEGISRRLAQEGAIVIMTDILDQVFETAQKIQAQGYQAKGYKMDVTKIDEIKAVAESVLAEFGKVDILVNNAGIARLAHFLDMSDEIRDLHFNVNLFGVWNCSKVFLPSMVKERYGRIINISSVTGPMVIDPGMTAYGTTKAALIGFTKGLARDFAKYGITVNAVLPGYILTPMVEHTAVESNPENPQSVIDGIASGVPLGRLGKIEEIGDLVVFLASDESSYITGTQIVIDGGSTLPETNTVGA